MSQQEKVKYFDRVKSVRTALGLTQNDLGAKLGVSGNLIYKIEAATKPLTGRTLRDFLALEAQLGQGKIDKDSVKAGLADAPIPADYATIEQCRERIKELEGRNAVLEAMVMAALKLRPISYRDNLSSKTGLSEDQAILKQVDENEEAQQRAARRQK
jgi:transcriptional regulator with XRE-family HTH domain